MVYRIGPAWAVSLNQLETHLQSERFVECSLTQEKSVGWVAPRGEVHQTGGALVESIGGQWMMKLMVETKAVPAPVINRKTKERITQVELATGRKLGKKASRELKDEVRQALLPMAFTKQGACLVWIDAAARLLVIDAASQGRADEALTSISKVMEGLGAMLLQTTVSPVVAMSDWLLSQEAPAGFSIDRECELKANDDSKAVVRYSRHALDIQEVQQHIAHGKQATRVGMTWQGRVSFVLTETLHLKKLTFVEGVFQALASHSKDDRFDTDTAIATGEIRQLIADLLEALGGEIVAGVNAVERPKTAESNPADDAPF